MPRCGCTGYQLRRPRNRQLVSRGDPLDWRPPPTFRERVLSAVGTPTLIGVLVFIAAVASAVILVLAQPHSPSSDLGSAGDSAAGTGESPLSEVTSESNAVGGADTSGTAGTPGASGIVYVHVVGEVHAPGVVELQTGDRVQQALAAAGGVTNEAVLVGVNLARLVSDGEQIVVPDSTGAAADLAASEAAPTGSLSNGAVNLNTADAGQLESLPRVGPSLAERILEWRSANGAFISVDQLLEVSGIGPKTLEGFRDRVLI